MNLETLVKICRGDLLDYGVLDANNVQQEIADKYELVENYVGCETSDIYSMNGLNAYYIIKNKETGTLYRIQTDHDSWEEDPEVQFENAIIQVVEKKEVTKFEYVPIPDTKRVRYENL